MTPELNDYVPVASTGELVFEDPIKSAERMVTLLKGKDVDAIVLLSHLGIGQGFIPSSDTVCSAVDGIDICINGHSHTPMEHGKFINDDRPLTPTKTMMADVGWKSQYVGIVSCVSGEYDAVLYKVEALHDQRVDSKVRNTVS